MRELRQKLRKRGLIILSVINIFIIPIVFWFSLILSIPVISLCIDIGDGPGAALGYAAMEILIGYLLSCIIFVLVLIGETIYFKQKEVTTITVIMGLCSPFIIAIVLRLLKLLI